MSKKTVPLAIFASSRSDGNTRKVLETAQGNRHFDFVDLSELNIAYYDYEHRNADDDFIPLAEKMQEYQTLILVSPVYWNTMSALMKTFIDRFSDLLTIRKDLGRGLKGKRVYVVCSYETSFPAGFEEAFRSTCDYMEMRYGGCLFHYCGNDAALLESNAEAVAHFQHLIDLSS